MELVSLSMDSSVDEIMTSGHCLTRSAAQTRSTGADLFRFFGMIMDIVNSWAKAEAWDQGIDSIKLELWFSSVADKETANSSSHVTNYCTKQRTCWLAESIGQWKGHSVNFQLMNSQLKWCHPWKPSKSSGFKGFSQESGKKTQQKINFPHHLFNSVSDCHFHNFHSFSVITENHWPYALSSLCMSLLKHYKVQIFIGCQVPSCDSGWHSGPIILLYKVSARRWYLACTSTQICSAMGHVHNEAWQTSSDILVM